VKTVLSVVGARPNFMKVAPLYRALAAYSGRIAQRVVHTGQHYDRTMSKVFFEDLQLPQPDFDLGVGSDPMRSTPPRSWLSSKRSSVLTKRM